MKTVLKLNAKIGLLIMLMILSLTGCKKDNNNGDVSVKVTDDPFPVSFVTEANVEIAKIELKNENGEYVTVLESSASTNMVNYTNGATAEIAVTAIPEGKYSEAKLTMGTASIYLSDSRYFNDTASANQSVTVKVSPELEVQSGQSQEILLDLDLSDSFELGGMFGGWFTSVAQITGITSFHPDFRAVSLSKTGSIEGHVTDSQNNAMAYCVVQVAYDYSGDGSPDTVSTIADAHGNYKIIGLPTATYEITVKADNHAEVHQQNVQVSISNTTHANITVN